MATQKPLEDLVPEILDHIQRNENVLEFNYRVWKILEGQLKLEVERSLSEEMMSKTAYNRAIKRIPSINVFKKVVDKLATVYSDKPLRLTKKEQDQKLMGQLVRDSDLDYVLCQADRVLEAHRFCALEPYIEDDKLKMRVVAGHQCLAFSDNVVNPMKPTVMIKLLGTEQRREYQKIAPDGTDTRSAANEITVNVYALYSDEEFMIVDSGGMVRRDKMAAAGSPDGKNPFGVIPFVYLNKSEFELVPTPNQEAFDISILIPKLITDLNYAAQFMSHSIIWVKNAQDLKGSEINPDVIVDLGDGDPESGASPEIGTIEPKTDIERVLQLIQYQLSGFMASQGIKTNNSGTMMPGREASGFSKIVDEADSSEERKKRTERWRVYEERLWSKMTKFQEYASSAGLVKESKQFSKEFVETFNIKYSESKVIKTDKQKLDEVKMWRELELMTVKQAIKTLRPEFSDEQVSKWVEELEEEGEARMEKMLSLGSSDSDFSVEEESIGREENGDGGVA